MSEILVEHVLRRASIEPQKVAIKLGSEVCTYADLFKYIGSISLLLKERYQVSSRKTVIISAEKEIHFIATYFALHVLGTIVVPISFESSSNTFSQIKKTVFPELIIGFQGEDSISYGELFEQLPDYFSFRNIPIPQPSLDDVADIMFTSGTTGTPKGVMLSHRNILFSTKGISNYVGNNKNDIEILALPISHSFGLGRMRSILYMGGTLILYPNFSNLKPLFKLIESENVTGFTMVPASWRFIKRFSGTRLGRYAKQLRYIEMGSAYLEPVEKQELSELFPKTRICMHYGLTEASRSFFMEFHKDNLLSVGKPIEGIEAQIFDEMGNVLEEGLEGEIGVKGGNVTLGYWKNSELTAESFFGDHYFRTGDLGYRKGNDFFLTGRLKEIINVGGKKVSPYEIEGLCNEFQGVLESACVGEKSQNGITGESVKVFLVVDEPIFDLQGLKSFLKASLEDFKLPTAYEIIDSIPKTENGKIKRLLLNS